MMDSRELLDVTQENEGLWCMMRRIEEFDHLMLGLMRIGYPMIGLIECWYPMLDLERYAYLVFDHIASCFPMLEDRKASCFTLAEEGVRYSMLDLIGIGPHT